MGLKKIADNFGGFWGVWKIEESIETLAAIVAPFETLPDSLTHPRKRLEWLAGRNLVKSLLENNGMTFLGIQKDDYGKPYPCESTFQLSLSHSYPYVAAYIHPTASVGVDLEQPKEKLLRIAHRVHSEYEQQHLGTDITKHCIAWCAKETLLKVYGKKDLVFAEDLQIMDFELKNSGFFTGKILAADREEIVSLYYQIESEFVLVLNNPTNLKQA